VPIILIPQLMFNGVAIEFDKLNPTISSSERVPILGELMISRWAYEAVMVRQFKDNKYQRIFYDQEKVVAEADYKNMHYLKALETNLSSCDAALRGAVVRDSIADRLDLIKYELSRELNQIGKGDIVNWEKLTPHAFDSAASAQIRETIQTLKRMYSARKNVALEAQEKWRHDNVVVTQKENEFLQLQREYSNEKINNMVENEMTMIPLIEVGDKLIRKTTLIYATPDVPENPLNFRTFYYAPEKYFAGRYFDTFWFNIIIIWIMAIIGLIALYMDLLKKLLTLFESIGDYNFRRKIQKAQSVFRK
jgi:ABC transport system ATP-binding/permease protein